MQLPGQHSLPSFGLSGFKSSPSNEQLHQLPGVQSNVAASLAASDKTVTPGGGAAFYRKQKFKLEHFHIMNTLGTGSFGRVHLVKHLSTSKFMAIKVLKKLEVVRLKQVEHTINEKTILERIDHPFMVNMFGTYQDCSNLYIVMEYVGGGELFSFLRRSGVRT